MVLQDGKTSLFFLPLLVGIVPKRDFHQLFAYLEGQAERGQVVEERQS